MQMNWVDWVIIVVLCYYLLQGWESGLVNLITGLISFLISLWFAVKYHSIVGNFLGGKFGIPAVWTSVLGYLIVAFVGEIILVEILHYFTRYFPKKFLESKANQWLGALVSVVNGTIIIAFFLLVLLALPLRGTVRADIKQSVLGKRFVQTAERYGGQVKSVLDQATKEVTKFITVEPGSAERVRLDVAPTAQDLRVDEEAQARMLELVNKERAKVGAPKLRSDPKIVTVARAHSRDMFLRRYFAHIDPEGGNAGDRMEAGGVSFFLAGENLAYAPDVDIAHEGLMESPGHKKNILDPQFHRVGIGVINTDMYGAMFTQNFAN